MYYKILTLIISTFIITALPLYKPVTDAQGITLYGYIVIGASILLVCIGGWTIWNDEKASTKKDEEARLLNKNIAKQSIKIDEQGTKIASQLELLEKIDAAMKKEGIVFKAETGSITYTDNHSSFTGISIENVSAKEMHVKDNIITDNRSFPKRGK